jgi:4-amino-4-deoxy-L-arabinose transferase-like glycosyltransferase
MTTAIYPTNTDSSARAAQGLSRRWPFGIAPAHLLLTLILLLAVYLNFSNLSAIGNSNTYYTAAVKSMLQSWHNFFFVAAEPGGSVSVDKPPVGLWLETLSAYFLGVNGFAVVLPNLIAGLLSIVVLYKIVKKQFGTGAGLLAALVLAVTPVMLVVQRDNTPDSMLILTLLLAAWAFVQATENGKVRYLWLGALLVGIGFNIKMLQAYLPLPAFFALNFFGAKTGWSRKIGHLALATLILLVVSFSWAVAVDMTPANQRPYVGSSETNSVVDLALGYNGASRLFGRFPGGFGRRFAPPQNFSTRTNIERTGLGFNFPNDRSGTRPNRLSLRNGANPRSASPSGSLLGGLLGFGSVAPHGGVTGGFAGGFGGDVGEPGVWRLFSRSLANEASWLLPFALLGLVVIAGQQKPKLPLSMGQQGALLWGGWLLTTVVFFSVAGFFHSYYLAMMGPPTAALVGGGAATLWEMAKKRPATASFLLVLLGAVTLAVQWRFISYYQVYAYWRPVAALLLLVGTALTLFFWNRENARGSLKMFALSAILLAMLLTPLMWTKLTMEQVNFNATLPSAYQGTGFTFARGLSNNAVDGNRPPGFPGGIPQINPSGFAGGLNEQTLAYLQEQTKEMKYLLAVNSSGEGSPLVLQTGRPVLFMGGFTGNDPVIGAQGIAQMVADRELRFVIDPGQRKEEISKWLVANCSVVNTSTIGDSMAGSSTDGFRGSMAAPAPVAPLSGVTSANGQTGRSSGPATGNRPRTGDFGGGSKLYDCQN